jgi:maleate cis-trans isomerase
MEKVERALVQGTVTFKVNCNDLMGMVTPEIANDPRKLEQWLEDKAFKIIDSANVEVEIDNDETVHITKETADRLTNEVLTDDDWRTAKKEDREFNQ